MPIKFKMIAFRPYMRIGIIQVHLTMKKLKQNYLIIIKENNWKTYAFAEYDDRNYFKTWANWRTLQSDDVRGASCTFRLCVLCPNISWNMCLACSYEHVMYSLLWVYPATFRDSWPTACKMMAMTLSYDWSCTRYGVLEEIAEAWPS